MSDRFRNIELDDVPHVPTDKLAQAVATPTVPAPMPFTGSAEHIAQEPDRSRSDALCEQERYARAAREAGIDWPDTRVPAGEALWGMGYNNVQSARNMWNRLPAANDSLNAVKNALASEKRMDVELKVNELRLDPSTSRMVRATEMGKKPGIAYSEHAFGQLMQQIPKFAAGSRPMGFVKSLLFIPPDLRAEVVNREIMKSNSTVTLRTKLATDGNRVARAVLSERYADVSDLDVAAAIEAGLGDELQGLKLDYKPGDDRSRFEVIYPNDIPVKTMRVGDMHRAFVQVLNGETGKSAIKIRPGLERLACYNATLSTGIGVEVTLKHLGDATRVKGAVRAAFRQALAQVETLIGLVQQSAGVKLPDGKSPSEVLAAIAKKYQMAGQAEAFIDTFQKSYADSPTLWGVTSAMTEAAQQGGNWWQQQQIEEAAGEVLQKQWVVLK